MVTVKPIARFCAGALLLYILLVLPWPGLRNTYRTVYVTAAEWMFGSFGSGGVVQIERLPTGGLNDIEIGMGRIGAETGGFVETSTWRMGYVPAAELVALVLATPIPWSRRWRALLWGLVLVNLFVVLRFALLLLHWYSGPYPFRLYEPSSFWSRALTLGYEFFFIAPTCSFLVPVLIWVLVALRGEDMRPALAARPSSG